MCFGPQHPCKKYGKSGLEISTVFPQLGKSAPTTAAAHAQVSRKELPPDGHRRAGDQAGAGVRVPIRYFTDWDCVLLGVDEGSLRELGTKQEQIAEFTGSIGGPWHGYPVWSLNESGASNRAAQKARPSKLVFVKMELKGLITTGQRRRLMKGDHV